MLQTSGPYARWITVWADARWANMTVEVPEPSHLDTLIRGLEAEIDGPLPQLAYELGHWCILPRQLMAS
jgi:hypothetical protein